MRKIFLLAVVFSLFMVGCGQVIAPAHTLTTTQSPGPAPDVSTPADAIDQQIEIETQSGTSYTLDWSPEGQTLAVGSGFEITLLSRDLRQTLAMLRPEGGALGISWNPDQTKLATVNGYLHRTVTIWDWDGASKQLTQAQEIDAGFDLYGVSWSPDGQWLATLADDTNCTIQIWDPNTWQRTDTFELEYTNPRRALNWSADSTTLYEAGELNGQIVMFGLHLPDGQVDVIARVPLDQANAFAITSDSKKIAIADATGRVRVLDPSVPEPLMQFQSVSQPVDMVWDPSGTTLAILDYKTTLHVRNVTP